MLLNLSKKLVIDNDLIKAPNLCDRFSSEDLQTIGGVCYRGYQHDLASRSKWERRMNAAMDLALQIQKEKNFPWPGAANVIFPLVTIAALQFSARSYTNLIQGTDIVRYRVPGEDKQGLLRAQGDRISKHMSWQVLEEDKGWEEEHDRLLINLGIVGTNFIKSYYDPDLRCSVGEMVAARDLVLDYWAKSVEGCVRKTQVIPLSRNEIYERVKRDLFRDILAEDWYNVTPQSQQEAAPQDNRQGVEPPPYDEEAPFKSLEQHRYFDFDRDGYAEPYIVTLEESSKKVLRIVARFEREEDIQRDDGGDVISIKPTEYFTKYSFIPSPDGGIYDVGFGILLGPLNEAVNTGINQLLDSGTMQNSMGGFLGRGAKIRGGIYTMAPWEWKRVDSQGDDLRKNLVQYPERQPSVVMFSLLSLLINYTDRAAGMTDPMVGVNPGQNTPAETSRNMIEQGSQVFSVVFKRVWRSLKEEFKKKHQLNALYLPLSSKFGSEGEIIRREDYRISPDQVVPSADPNVTSSVMRLTQAMGIKQAASVTPGYDPIEVERNFLRALRVEGIDKLFPGPDKIPPRPDMKMQIEELRLKGKALQLRHDKEMLVVTLMAQRQKNDAEIAKLRAEEAAILAGIQTDQAVVQLQAFDSAIAAMTAHNDAINQSIETMKGDSEDGESTGVRSLAPGPGNSGVPAGANGLEGSNQGAMGAGGLPE